MRFEIQGRMHKLTFDHRGFVRWIVPTLGLVALAIVAR